MIKNQYISAALALALAMSGCCHDDPSPTRPSALVLSAAIYDIAAEDASVWHSGEPFGVYMLDGAGAPLSYNARHLADNRGATGYLVPEGTPLYLPSDGSQVSVTAYHPYDEAATSNGNRTTITIRGNMAPDACLWATAKNLSKNQPKATLRFKSQLAQIRARILNDDPATARIVARIEGAPGKCEFDILEGRYTGTPDCSSPLGITVKATEGAFELDVVVAATESAEGGPGIVVTALDKSGREIRTYPKVAVGAMLGLENGRTFMPNTVYNLAGTLDPANLHLQFTGSSPICIITWGTDPDEEFGTIIKDRNTNQ